MATNLVQDYGVFDWTNSTGADVVSGQVVRIGNTIGIALVNIPIGATGAVDCTPGRCWTVPKVSGAVFAAGEKLLWDASAGAFDDSAATPATTDVMGGVVAVKPGANLETTCVVMLTPGNTTLTA